MYRHHVKQLQQQVCTSVKTTRFCLFAFTSQQLFTYKRDMVNDLSVSGLVKELLSRSV